MLSKGLVIGFRCYALRCLVLHQFSVSELGAKEMVDFWESITDLLLILAERTRAEKTSLMFC
jgi:hypothetical protein